MNYGTPKRHRGKFGSKMAFKNTFKDRRILVTGCAGFKGSWLSMWLNMLGAKVFGYGLHPDTNPAAHKILKLSEILAEEKIADIRDEKTLNAFVEKNEIDTVFHLAAQPIVRASYADPIYTYQTNVIGTLNVLEAARKSKSVKVFVNVTTDKCYENKEISYSYKESDPMGGYDMYSSSKGCSEILTASYRRSFLADEKPFALASARAGNVIGGGDWAQDRLIPDCVRALVKGEKIVVRNPLAVRPWQHVLEPLAGYLTLAQNLWQNPKKFSQGYNFGPDPRDAIKVADIVEKMIEVWGEGETEFFKTDNLHEANLLQLDIDKAEKELGFFPVKSAFEAIEMTAQWYKNFYSNKSDMRDFSEKQITEFTADALKKNLIWSK